MLPESVLDADDFPPGPDGLAQFVAARIDELEAHRLTLRTRAEKRPINKHLYTLRGMLKWCRTRHGYTGNE